MFACPRKATAKASITLSYRLWSADAGVQDIAIGKHPFSLLLSDASCPCLSLSAAMEFLDLRVPK